MLLRKHFVGLALFFSLFSVKGLLLADSDPNSPPNPYDTAGGKTSPAFSDANAQSIYWLNLIDQMQFGPSWLEAGSLFRDLITQDQWVAAMNGTRKPLGSVRTRKVNAFNVVNSLPYGTQGNFMIITYRTEFSNQPNRVEEVILMTQGPLHQWKVIHYDVKK